MRYANIVLPGNKTTVGAEASYSCYQGYNLNQIPALANVTHFKAKCTESTAWYPDPYKLKCEGTQKIFDHEFC